MRQYRDYTRAAGSSSPHPQQTLSNERSFFMEHTHTHTPPQPQHCTRGVHQYFCNTPSQFPDTHYGLYHTQIDCNPSPHTRAIHTTTQSFIVLQIEGNFAGSLENLTAAAVAGGGDGFSGTEQVLSCHVPCVVPPCAPPPSLLALPVGGPSELPCSNELRTEGGAPWDAERDAPRTQCYTLPSEVMPLPPRHVGNMLAPCTTALPFKDSNV